MSKVKKQISIILFFSAIFLSCMIALIVANTGTTAHAASNTGIQTLSSVESTYHKVQGYSTFAPTPPTDYTEEFTTNTGIAIYGTSNNSSISTTNRIKVDCSTMYIDFTNARELYVPEHHYAINLDFEYYDVSYSFQILQGSTVKWYANYSYTTHEESRTNGSGLTYTVKRYDITLNINGTSTTTTSDTKKSIIFNPANFGKHLIGLSDGTYTIQINRNYIWIELLQENGYLPICGTYNTTSTLSAPLIVDTTTPTMSLRGYTSGKTLANGAVANERATFTVNDSNPYRIYYKAPTSTTYTYTTASSYTCGTTNGTYSVYAVDAFGHQSDVYTFSLDTVAPTGYISSNGSNVTNGSCVSNSFSYSATDSRSGVASLYYKTPVNSSFQQYTAGTIIPANAGDGLYYFYAVDAAGNQSATISVCLDATKPKLTLTGYTSGNNISNGSNVNEQITVTATDTHFSRIYYKTPASSDYTYTTATYQTLGTVNGLYYVYAEDSVGNESEVVSFYYDTVAPVGSITCNDLNIESGGYVGNSFSYYATDYGCGVENLYYKTPARATYMPYSLGMLIPKNLGDGWYYFYSVDKAGNQSAVMSVYLETQAPLVDIYRNNKLAYSKSITEAGTFDTDIYINTNDTLKISCDTSSGKMTSNYTLDTNITIGSAYTGNEYTITLTSATGITSNFIYHIVRKTPTITIEGTNYSSGSILYFNSDKTVYFNDDPVIVNSGNTGAIIISEGNVNLNEQISYASGSNKTLTTASGTETKYILTLNDRADNVSTFTVIIDKLAPEGVWITNGNNIPDGGYTNKQLSFNFTEAGVTGTYSFNGGEYKSLTSGQTFTEDGTYIVILTDRANNKSTFTAHIDTIPPIGQMYANYAPIENGTITNAKVYFTWDGELTATINGTAYTKNTVLSNDGTYTFTLTDSAQNTTVYTVTIDTIAPTHNVDKLQTQSKMITKWYVVNFDGKNYSFPNYDEALVFACDMEFGSCVTVLVLDDVTNFNQHHLIADGSEVRTGEYWLYKSKANPDSFLYYFDRTVLSEVIAYYAKENISTVNYFILDGNNVYGEPANSMSDNVFTAPDGTQAPVLNGFIFDRADGSELYAELVGGNGAKVKIEYGVAFDKQITIGGLYKLTELDEAGNKTIFYGFSDILAPELKVTATIYGNSSTTELNITKDSLVGIAAYYYESFDVRAIIDADKWSVLSIKNGNQMYYYTFGDDLPCLNIGGEYHISVYDRNENGYSFTVFIVGNPASVTIQNNNDDTAFELHISLEQHFDTVVFLEIRKNGVMLDGISTSVLHYTFDRAGTYLLTLRDNFGRTITKEYVFVKALPEGTLSGVENGGKSKTDISFTFDNAKYYAVVTKNGQAFTTNYGGELFFNATDGNSGNYAIRLIRLTDEDNYTDYGFTLNTLAPDFEMSVENDTTTNKNVTISWSADDIVSIVYTRDNGEVVELKNGSVLSAEGTYVVTATNDLGTQNMKYFTIDKTVDYYIEVGNEPAKNVEVTNESIVVFNGEALTIAVMKNGETYDYVFGDILLEEGYYTFRIADNFGNLATFSVTIDKSVSYSANIGNGLISSENVQIVNDEKLTVTVTKDNQVIDYIFGQPLDEEGSYKVVMKDTYGNEKSLEFSIVKGVKRTLDYTLGKNVNVLSIDRNGEVISSDGNRINFTESGVYTITAEVDGTTYSFVLELDNIAPTLELNGVKDGGTSGKSVTLDNLSEPATIEVYKDGELIEYELGNELIEFGNYRVVVTDEAGNQTEYTFTLKHILNGGAVALIVIGIIVLVGGITAVLIMRKKGIFGKIKAVKSDSKSVKKD